MRRYTAADYVSGVLWFALVLWFCVLTVSPTLGMVLHTAVRLFWWGWRLAA